MDTNAEIEKFVATLEAFIEAKLWEGKRMNSVTEAAVCRKALIDLLSSASGDNKDFEEE